MLGESCGQSTARASIDLFTSIFLTLLKLFTSDTRLYILQRPREPWLSEAFVSVCFDYTTQFLLRLLYRGQGLREKIVLLFSLGYRMSGSLEGQHQG